MPEDSVRRFQLSEKITVSLVIPHFSPVREENLNGLLDEIREQTFKEVEIIVVCGVSPQGKAINHGARLAKGEILVVMDDDARMGPHDVIEKLVKALRENPAIGMAGASVLTPESANAFQRRAATQFPRFHMPVVKQITDSDLACHGCVAFPMAFFQSIGMEREDILRGLDPDLRVRIRSAGRRVVLIPDTWVYHPLPSSLGKFIRIFFRNGYGSAYMQWVHPELNYDTHEALDLGDFIPKRSFFFRLFRFPFRLLESLVTLKWIRFLGYFVYPFGYLSGIVHLGWARLTNRGQVRSAVPVPYSPPKAQEKSLKILALIFLFSTALTAGCSVKDWRAKASMVKAENAMSKAARLKDQKVPFEKRVVFYKQACGHFSDAYARDSRVFTFNRIEEAVDACWKAEDREKEEMFRTFQEKYVKAHPVEYEHGDAGVNMEMGG